MLVEELLALPVGTHVMGGLQTKTTLPGVVKSMKDGPNFIRWSDGYVTFPFGWVRDYDEYIAVRTEIQPSRCTRIHYGENETHESTVSRALKQAT